MGLSEAKAERLKVKANAGGRLAIVVCFLLSALSFQPAKAQTFDEWFAQKKTLIRYLAAQIAYLRTYEHGLLTGYQEAKGNLVLIGRFKDGELALHAGYYRSLQQVKPAVMTSADLADMPSYFATIREQLAGLATLPGLSVNESVYVGHVVNGVLDSCVRDLGELNEVMANDALSMTDGERIGKLRQLCDAIRETRVFACGFASSVRLLAARRLRDGQEASGLGKLYGVQ
jgi:hypothetical protein